MTIRNNHDLRTAYEILREISNFEKEGLIVNHKDTPTVQNLKRNIRKFIREAPVNDIIANHGMDGYTRKYQLSGYNFPTFEEAEEYFMETEYIRPRYSAYDCTGCAFTSWYKLFQRDGKWWVYHHISFDF